MDVKMVKKFCWKAIFMADGYKTETTRLSNYSTVVSWDTVIICLNIVAFNYLNILPVDVDNADISATCCEWVWMHAGPEFSNCEGKVLITRQALYGLKSSGAAFR